jgi:hypothetical protein
VLVRWEEPDGSEPVRGHFIAINGYRVTSAGTQYVSIEDPFFEDEEIEFEKFNNATGGYRDGTGIWVATFFTRPPEQG